MSFAGQESAYIFLHLTAQSNEWAAIITQFVLVETARRGRGYAAWACDRLTRAITCSEGIVAMNERGEVCGLTIFEITSDAVEISFPWCRDYKPDLLEDMAKALLQVLNEQKNCPAHRRAERPITPGDTNTYGLEQAGFICHWRMRMQKDLNTSFKDLPFISHYRLLPWNSRYIDETARVIFEANQGTLDALLYAPFFGDSPTQCRKGLLTILAGRYGKIDTIASQVALDRGQFAGVILVIDEGSSLASIVEISVQPTSQRQGIGQALMEQAMQVLSEKHFERVELAVTRDNIPAIKLYESLGFYPVGDFPVCYWPGK